MAQRRGCRQTPVNRIPEIDIVALSANDPVSMVAQRQQPSAENAPQCALWGSPRDAVLWFMQLLFLGLSIPANMG